MNGLSTALESLAARDRRRLLNDLRRDGPLELEEPATVVVDGSGRDLDELAAELRHVHLPQLAEAGYIEHDAENGIVRKGPKFDEIEPLLRLMTDHAEELPEGWF